MSPRAKHLTRHYREMAASMFLATLGVMLARPAEYARHHARLA